MSLFTSSNSPCTYPYVLWRPFLIIVSLGFFRFFSHSDSAVCFCLTASPTTLLWCTCCQIQGTALCFHHIWSLSSISLRLATNHSAGTLSSLLFCYNTCFYFLLQTVLTFSWSSLQAPLLSKFKPFIFCKRPGFISPYTFTLGDLKFNPPAQMFSELWVCIQLPSYNMCPKRLSWISTVNRSLTVLLY